MGGGDGVILNLVISFSAAIRCNILQERRLARAVTDK
jgi:hypothetical protein